MFFSMTDNYLSIYSDLPSALAKKQFYLVFQPIVDISEGRIVSYEALIRWLHPDCGLISPADFIPIAETMNIISEIDLWVLESVLNLNFENIPIHVNISGRDLSTPGFLTKICDLIGSEKDKIILEFTETAQIDFTPQLIFDIKDLGLRLAVDDFGTGYSSLVLLNTLKVNMLKIDIHFIKNMLHDIDSAVITDSIIRLGNSLNMEVISEGVETYEQLQHLYRNGCRLIQGFYISKPMLYSDLNSFSPESFKLSPQEKYIQDTDHFIKRYANNALILLELDESLNYIRLTENFCSYLGYPMDQLKGKSFYEMITQDQMDYFHFIIQRLIISGYVDNVILNLIRQDRSLKSTVFSARMENKSSRSIIVYLEDYTFYNDKIDEINGVRNAYSIMFHEGPLATIVWKSDYEIVDWNNESVNIFGWSSNEAIGKNLVKLIAPSEKLPFPQVFEDVFTQDHVESINSNIAKNGTVIICRWINKTLRDSEGKIRFIISMVTDITENLIKNDNLRMLSTAIEKSGSAVIITDDEGIVEYSNTQFREMSAYEDGLIGKNIDLISSHEHPVEYYKLLWKSISEGKTWSGEFHNRRKYNDYYWCTSVIVPVKSTVTGLLKYICIQEDMTELREKESQLNDIKRAMEQNELLSSIGAMLSGIIHEVKSPLSTISSNMNFLEKFFLNCEKVDDTTFEAFKDIQSGLKHLNQLMTSYKNAVQGSADSLKECFELQKEISTVLDITRNEYKYDMFIDFKPESPINLYGSPSDIRQVVMNLLINAVYSVKKRSQLTPGLITISTCIKDQMVRFEIHDNGPGIPLNIIENIFDPFFTTKPAPDGTGLGLSICKSIIEERFHGVLGANTQSGDTEFYFEIPFIENEVDDFR